MQKVKLLSKSYYPNKNGNLRSVFTLAQQPKMQGLVKFSIIGGITGAVIGTGYAYYKINEARKNIALEGTQAETVLLKHKPPVVLSRKVF